MLMDNSALLMFLAPKCRGPPVTQITKFKLIGGFIMSNEILDKDIVLAKFLMYMKKALYHKRVNYLKHRDKNNNYEVELDEIDIPYSDEIIEDDEMPKFSILNREEIKLLKLLYIQDLSYKEISIITNERIDTLKKRRGRAIKKLKEKMEE